MPAKKSLISIQDRGFRFGDGVFETCLIRQGVIYNFEAHLARLNSGLKAIKIKPFIPSGYKNASQDAPHFVGNPIPHVDGTYGKINLENKNNFDEDLKKTCTKLIKKNQIKNGYLRIAISRGVGSFGYLPIQNISPNIVIEIIEAYQKPRAPIKLCISQIEKPSLKSLPVNYKLMQGLNSTLVKLEAVENDCFDAIILNHKKQICETSSANIFWIKDNVLYTPDIECGCLDGTIRKKIITLCPIKIKLVKTSLKDFLLADEAFITNVSVGVLAIDKIVDKEFTNKKYSTIFTNLLNQDIKNYVTKATAKKLSNKIIKKVD